MYKFNIDCFLFTDSTLIGDIAGWTVVRMGLGKAVNGIPASRVRIKDLKFRGHPRLKPYRYWIHVDTSRAALKHLQWSLSNGLLEYVRCHPSKALFLREHGDRATIQQEINVLQKDAYVLSKKLQPLAPLNKWDAYLRPMYPRLNRVRLTWNNLFVVDTSHKHAVSKWASIYDTLLHWGLYRDQVVTSFALVDVQGMVSHINPYRRMTCKSEPAHPPNLCFWTHPYPYAGAATTGGYCCKTHVRPSSGVCPGNLFKKCLAETCSEWVAAGSKTVA